MSNLTLIQRLERLPVEAAAAPEVSLRREGGRLVLETGERRVRRSRRSALLGGATLTVGGLTVALATPWGWALAAAGAIAAGLAPRLLQPAAIAEIDLEGGLLAGCLPTEEVIGLHAVYETRGWDGGTTFFATLASGEEVPFASVGGSDDALVEQSCALLGYLLACPATSTGTFGEIKTCFMPTAPAPRGA
jgi:hypothetical protein